MVQTPPSGDNILGKGECIFLIEANRSLAGDDTFTELIFIRIQSIIGYMVFRDQHIMPLSISPEHPLIPEDYAIKRRVYVSIKKGHLFPASPVLRRVLVVLDTCCEDMFSGFRILIGKRLPGILPFVALLKCFFLALLQLLEVCLLRGD